MRLCPNLRRVERRCDNSLGPVSFQSQTLDPGIVGLWFTASPSHSEGWMSTVVTPQETFLMADEDRDRDGVCEGISRCTTSEGLRANIFRSPKRFELRSSGRGVR